jgi:hypothetical protein
VEGDNHGKGGQFLLGDRSGPAVGVATVHAAIEDHHLAVHAIEGAQPEVSMAEQLPDGGIAVVAAGQKAGDGGNLVGLGGARGHGDCDKEDERKHAPDHQANHGKLLVTGVTRPRRKS